MSVVSVKARSFILALFIRDDGERFLLGDNGYDFKEKQLHFAGNNIENDEVAIQGADGVLLAGQVRRASVQSFDGYVGDGSVSKERIEQMRRDFIGFFAKGHHFRVIYIDCARNAWQRKGGYLVDAPEVKELWQIHPEYHVGLNFEDVNYYEYDEDAEGEEVLSNLFNLPISSAVEGGLVWDEDGAVAEDAETDEVRGEVQSASGSLIELDLSSGYGRLDSATIKGNTSQSGTPTPDAPVPVQTVTGENVVKICGKNLLASELSGTVSITGASIVFSGSSITVNRTTGAVSYTQKTNTLQYAIANGQKLAFSMNYKSGTINANGTYQWRFGVYGIKVDGTSERFGDLYLPYNTTTPSASVILTATSDYVGFALGCYLSSSTNTTTGDVVFDCQLELGSTATAYEPYQGQSYEINLGKNMLDLSTFAVGGMNNGTADPSNKCRINNAANPIKVEPNTTYSISCVLGDTVKGFRVGVHSLTGSKTFISDSGWNQFASSAYTFTTGATTEYIALIFSLSTTSTDVTTGGTENTTVCATVDDFMRGSKLQVELGDATGYADYFTPIELCKIGDYQDYIYKSGGKWYVHKECEHRSISASSRSGIDVAQTNTARVNYGAILSSKKPTYAVAGYMNYAVAASASNWGADNAGFFWDGGNGGFWVRFLKSAVGSTTTDVDSFLSGKTFELYYPLATTPADTEITNQALITQLEALRTASLASGENNIALVSPNIAGELEISYYGYEIIAVSGGYVWEAGGSGGPTILINDSISNVMPIWTVFGPALNPQLENITTGSVIQYVGSVAEGQTLVVDMGEQTANLSGLNVISSMVGDWIDLAPGSNRMIYSADADNTPDSEIGWSDIVG